MKSDELGRSSAEGLKDAERTPIIVILDDLRSAHNVGSIFRTSDAFLIEEIMLCGYTPTPPHREIAKTALGSTETVPWRHFKSGTEAIHAAREAGYNILAIEHTDSSELLDDPNIWNKEKTALVFGNEVKGVSHESLSLCDSSVEIPMFGSKHSFNVSVCAGMVLWEAWKAAHRPK